MGTPEFCGVDLKIQNTVSHPLKRATSAAIVYVASFEERPDDSYSG